MLITQDKYQIETCAWYKGEDVTILGIRNDMTTQCLMSLTASEMTGQRAQSLSAVAPALRTCHTYNNNSYGHTYLTFWHCGSDQRRALRYVHTIVIKYNDQNWQSPYHTGCTATQHCTSCRRIPHHVTYVNKHLQDTRQCATWHNIQWERTFSLDRQLTIVRQIYQAAMNDILCKHPIRVVGLICSNLNISGKGCTPLTCQ